MTIDRQLPESVQRTLAAYGAAERGLRRAHAGPGLLLGSAGALARTRQDREDAQNQLLAPGATLSVGAGERHTAEEPDPVRTCFERDLDRVRHSQGYRALAGKQQVFLDADGGLRTRLTHSTEVSQIAGAVAQAVGANETLAVAAGLAHDVGHTPCGHDGEVAFAKFVPGFDHATFGADVALASLNLCTQTLDAVRQHSWRLGAPSTPEGEVVSWADRIAYTTSDFEDAVRAGVVSPSQLPDEVADVVGERPSRQIGAFIDALVRGTLDSGVVSMPEDVARALDVFRKFNYETIYLREAARRQADRAMRLLTELVEYYVDRPGLLRVAPLVVSGSEEAAELAVRHVGGMTDRTVLNLGLTVLGWSPDALPRGA